MAENRPDSQPPRLDPLVAGPPRFGPGARTLIVAGMVGACAMGAGAGTWARPDLSDLKQAEVEDKAPRATPAHARPVLQIVDADLMPPPSERLEVLPAWIDVPIPTVVEPGPLRKVVLEEPPPKAPLTEPARPVKARLEKHKAKIEPRSETRKTERSKAEKAQPEPKLVKAKAERAKDDRAKDEEAKPERPRGEKAKLDRTTPEKPKLRKAKAEKAQSDKPKLLKAKGEKPEKTKAEISRKTVADRTEEPRLIKAKVEKPAPKRIAKTKADAPAKIETSAPSKLRQAIAKLKPVSKPKDTLVAASPAKPNKVEKVQQELAELSALPVEKPKPMVAARARPEPKSAPEKPRCHAGSRAEALLCENPQLAAADRRLARAYREAAEAGAPEWRLRRQQNRWLAARERAAEEAPWAVAEVYDARIAELEDEAALARERF